MIYRWLATLVVVVHAAFVVFVVFGGFLVLRWRRLVWLHVPAAVWGVAIEVIGFRCPLTPLENALRLRAGEPTYSGTFIEHHLMRLLYPVGLTPSIQHYLAAFVVLANVVAYTLVWRRTRRGD
jgi:ABC-type branched-subunit amino acid transport system permease subunit